MLINPVYAGYVHAPEWEVSLRKGHHEGLISFETHQKILARREEGAKVPARKNISEDFPLRGAVLCGHCAMPLTACWTQGRTGRHPYYLCQRPGCESKGKSIRRDKIEGEFEALLRGLQPTENLFHTARAMFENLWNHRLTAVEAQKQALTQELAKVNAQVEQFLDRLAEADTPSVIKAYEGRIRKLEEQRLVVEEKMNSGGRPVRSFNQTLRTAFDFLQNPWKLWASGRFEDKRTVLKLAFLDRLVYVRNEGFRTANLALPFKHLV